MPAERSMDIRVHTLAAQAACGPMLLMCLCVPTGAQTTPARAATPAPSASAPTSANLPTLKKVEIVGTRVQDDSAEAIGSKFVLIRVEIDKFGDTPLSDVLRRIPGVTLGSGTGQARDIRMRGLGGGYVQLQINGLPVPATFFLDSMPSNMVEKVELIRAPSADTSAQAMAGSINIVLRKPREGQRTLRMTAGGSGGQELANLSSQVRGRWNSVDAQLAAALSYQRDHRPVQTEFMADEGLGTPLLRRKTDVFEVGESVSLDLTPGMTWKLDDASLLSIDALAQFRKLVYTATESRVTTLGPQAIYPKDDVRIEYDTFQGRLTGRWKKGDVGTGLFDTKATYFWVRQDKAGSLAATTPGVGPILDRTITAALRDHGLTISSKYSWSLAKSQTTDIGLEATNSKRSETKVQRDRSDVGFPLVNLDEEFNVDIIRTAVFVQRTTSIDKAWSATYGVRSESFGTRVDAPSSARTSNQVHLVNPSLQILWNVPQSLGDQFRLGVSRTFKPPTANDLIARRLVVQDNSPTSSDIVGNPDLRPETAWGIDVGWERRLTERERFGLNVYARRVHNVILQEVTRDNEGWVTTPRNLGRANVHGVEWDSRLRLRTLIPTASDIAMRFGITRNWSRVAAAQGPDNRLGQQQPFSAQASLDHKIVGTGWDLGLEVKHVRNGQWRGPNGQATDTASVTTADMYALLTIPKVCNLRITLLNLFSPKSRIDTTYTGAAFYQVQRQTSPTYPGIRVTVELVL